MKHTSWSVKLIPLKDLVLWDDNPRTFNVNSPNPQEKEIIGRYEVSKLLNIARNIIKFQDANLQPGEMTVIEKNGKYVIYDGNRRISAYKLLLDIKKLPKKNIEFEKLASLVKFDENKVLSFSVAPSIEAALDRVSDLHTHNFHENWHALARANFASLQIDEQIETLKREKEHIKRAKLYKLVKSLRYSTKIRAIITDPKKFSITTFERIVGSSVGKKYLKYDFDRSFNIALKGTKANFEKLIKQIAEDVASGKVDSRKQSTNKAIEIYLKSIIKALKVTDGKPVATSIPLPIQKKCFVIMPLAGLDKVYSVIKESWQDVFGKESSIFNQPDSPSKKHMLSDDEMNEFIAENIVDADVVVGVLSMGKKETRMYKAVKAKDRNILSESFPINPNVLVEIGHRLGCKSENLILIAEKKTHKFVTKEVFDLRNKRIEPYEETVAGLTKLALTLKDKFEVLK